MRRVGYKVFAHLHALDLAFHLDRRTGGLSRDIEIMPAYKLLLHLLKPVKVKVLPVPINV